MGDGALEELAALHRGLAPAIEERLRGFRELWEGGSEEELFAEAAFCLLTPQSGARRCWRAVLELRERGLLLGGTAEDVAGVLARSVRFHRTKARRVVAARAVFSRGGRLAVREALGGFADGREARRWLVREVDGLGHKEASHLLRNLGMGERLAILDRHILRELVRLGCLDSLPRSLPPSRYLAVEERMEALSRRAGVPLAHLDLLFWYRATGELFK